MTDDEILERLIPNIPSGNIDRANDEQALMLLPVVRKLIEDSRSKIDVDRLRAAIVPLSEMRRW